MTESNALVVSRPQDMPAAGSMALEAKEYEIDDQTTYELAGDRLQYYLNTAATWEAERKKATVPIDAAKAQIQSWFKPVIDDAKAAAAFLKDIRLEYEKKARAFAQEANAIAEKAAREMREKVAAQAVEAEAKGDIEVAEVLRETAQSVVATPVPTGFVRGAGSYSRMEWRAEIEDHDKAVMALVGADLLEILDINESKLKKLAALKQDKMPLTGIRFFEHEIAAQRRKA